MAHIFNDDILEFRILPKDINEIDLNRDKDILYEFQARRSRMFDYLMHGIRWNTNKNKSSRFICVLCSVELNIFKEIDIHIKQAHVNKEVILRNTPLKPIVGLEDIVQFKDSDQKSVHEYRCNLCSLNFNPRSIIWHILSYQHKENFFKTKYSSDFINQINDPKLKHEKVDQVLLNYEKTLMNRGHFITKIISKGMIASSSSSKFKLNIGYVESLYSYDKQKLESIYKKLPEIEKLKKKINLKIQNSDQMKQAKEFLQKLNVSLMDYKNLDESFKIVM